MSHVIFLISLIPLALVACSLAYAGEKVAKQTRYTTRSGAIYEVNGLLPGVRAALLLLWAACAMGYLITGVLAMGPAFTVENETFQWWMIGAVLFVSSGVILRTAPIGDKHRIGTAWSTRLAEHGTDPE